MSSSPWGTIDQSTQIGLRGVRMVSTPSHGGYMVTNALGDEILSHEAKKIGKHGYAHSTTHYCFEEDCDWAIVEWENATVREAARQKNMEWAVGYALQQISTPEGYVLCLRSTVSRWNPAYYEIHPEPNM